MSPCVSTPTSSSVQQQIAELFNTSQQNVSLHLRNIYEENELSKRATHKDFLLLRKEGARNATQVYKWGPTTSAADQILDAAQGFTVPGVS